MRGFISLIELKLSKFYNRIISNVSLTVDQLSYYRIFIGLFFLLNRPVFSWLGDIPTGLFKPNVLTIAKLFSRLPDAMYFEITDVVSIILLITVTLGIKSRLSFLILFFLTILNNSFAYSFGKIDHSIFSSLIFLLMFFTNSGTKYALWPDKKWPIQNQNLALAIFAICLSFAFLTAGFEKAIKWVDFDLTTSGILSWFYRGYFDLGRDALLADQFFQAPSWLLESMDYIAVLFETTAFLFLLLNRRSWYFYLILASFFHFTNVLILNIPFTTHFIVYGIWVLSPLIKNNKWIYLVPFVNVFVKDLHQAVILWVFFLIFGLKYWFSIQKNLHNLNSSSKYQNSKITNFN